MIQRRMENVHNYSRVGTNANSSFGSRRKGAQTTTIVVRRTDQAEAEDEAGAGQDVVGFAPIKRLRVRERVE